jgi:hypothetical protein
MKKLLLLLALFVCLPAKADYIGDFLLGDTITYEYNTLKATDGSDLQRTAAGTASCIPNGSGTEITAGITDTGTTAFDTTTGLNKLTIVASTGNGYAVATDYVCTIRASTLNAVTVSYGVVSFSLENRSGTRSFIKDRGTLSAGSSTTTIQLGAKLSSSNVWNGMTFYDITTNEKAAICSTTDNGATDTLSVLGLVTTPGSSDSYQILNNGPLSCINLPKVDANGHVYVGYFGTSGSGEPACSDKCGSNINYFFDNNGQLATLPTVQGVYNAVTTVWTTTIDTKTTGCILAAGLSVLTGPSSISGSTANYKDPSNTNNRVAGTFNANGERPSGSTITCPGGY